MSNPISARRVRVETIDEAGRPTGEVSYGIVASDNTTTLFADTWESAEELTRAIVEAGSILAAVDPEGKIEPVDHGVIGVGPNYYGTDAWLGRKVDHLSELFG